MFLPCFCTKAVNLQLLSTWPGSWVGNRFLSLNAQTNATECWIIDGHPALRMGKFARQIHRYMAISCQLLPMTDPIELRNGLIKEVKWAGFPMGFSCSYLEMHQRLYNQLTWRCLFFLINLGGFGWSFSYVVGLSLWCCNLQLLACELSLGSNLER